MNLLESFAAVVRELQSREIPFAVAGGFAASLYRDQPRLTQDVDLGIHLAGNRLQVAQDILQNLGLKTGVARAADLAGGPLFAIKQKSTEPVMVVGRFPGEDQTGAVYLLLPSLPWVANSIKRAQSNPVDFGFGRIPTLTVEDVILSKLYAIQSKVRPKDLDDIDSIFNTKPTVEWTYLQSEIKRMKLKLPSTAKPFLPDVLCRLLRT